jgi:hypothetical protein
MDPSDLSATPTTTVVVILAFGAREVGRWPMDLSATPTTTVVVILGFGAREVADGPVSSDHPGGRRCSPGPRGLARESRRAQSTGPLTANRRQRSIA